MSKNQHSYLIKNLHFYLDIYTDELSESEINSKLEQFIDKDTDISPWARKYIVQSINMGITEGYPDNTMRGTKLLNHAEVITLIDRMIQSIE